MKKNLKTFELQSSLPQLPIPSIEEVNILKNEMKIHNLFI